MKHISTLGWYYAIYSLVMCGYFCVAAIAGWPGPNIDYGGSGSSSFRSGSASGRSSGGSWGGGK